MHRFLTYSPRHVHHIHPSFYRGRAFWTKRPFDKARGKQPALIVTLTGHHLLRKQGQELENLRRRHPYQRIVYCGDGANDLCPALSLTPSDVVLARAGFALDRLISERAAGRDEDGRIVARVHRWADHEELFELVQKVME